MRVLIALLLFITLHFSSLAQTDSLISTRPTINNKISVDSAGEKLTHLPDSLMSLNRQIDSMQMQLNNAAENLQNEYFVTVSKIDYEIMMSSKSIDSLSSLNLPSDSHERKLDSLQLLRETTEQKFTTKLERLKSATKEKLSSLNVPAEYREPLQKISHDLDGIRLHEDIIAIPELKIPTQSNATLNAPTVPPSGMGVSDKLGNTNIIDGIDTREVGDISRHVKGYEQDFKEVASGDLDRVENLPETIEQQASQIDGIDALQKNSDIVNGHQARLVEMQDGQQVEKAMANHAQKAVADHFAGKQEQLKAAMEKVATYKEKYSSVSSIKELPKRAPNPLKGKPLVERVVPGVYFQYQQRTFYLADVNLYIGYRLFRRMTVGMGWNQRYAYDKTTRQFNTRARIFGPRSYVDFGLAKGFIAHFEGESMNTFVPSTLNGNPDSGHREWVCTLMTGIKKEYKIFGNLRGTALIQYNIFNRKYKAPYVDRLNSRIGFEYTLKQNSRKKE